MTEIRNSILKDLIDRQLILQEFKKLQEKGANIPEYAIDNKIQEIIRNDFAGDRTAFVRTLQAQGYTLTRFKEIQRDIIIVQAMRQSKMSDSFVISPIQIQNFYEKNKSTYSTPEQVKLRMIILRERRRCRRRQQKADRPGNSPEDRRGRGVRPHGADVFRGRDHPGSRRRLGLDRT